MEALARLVLALFFVAILIQFLKRGPAGVKAWWRAKFLGQVQAPRVAPA